jgi:hypothetical protein
MCSIKPSCLHLNNLIDLLLTHPQKCLFHQQTIPKNHQLTFSAAILFSQQISHVTLQHKSAAQEDHHVYIYGRWNGDWV